MRLRSHFKHKTMAYLKLINGRKTWSVEKISNNNYQIDAYGFDCTENNYYFEYKGTLQQIKNDFNEVVESENDMDLFDSVYN